MSATTLEFEAAADAIVAGRADILRRLLANTPQLIHAQSPRPHRATLLHYVAANGVEESRQKTPPNIVEVTDILLQSGSHVNATANLYQGNATTLGLAATSIHPQNAGVLEPLLAKLLQYRADIQEPCLVTNCLANGRLNGAQYLASRGAPLNLAEAAGLGNLDLVKSLMPHAPTSQLNEGFLFACHYGQNQVVQFMVESGIDLTVSSSDGQTALHWAVIGAQLATVNLLMTYKLPLEVKNKYGGTVLEQARWSAAHTNNKHPYEAIVDRLLAAGAK